jgi:hypothetical protein
MAEAKGMTLAILGIVAVLAVVGLVLLFSGATGKVSYGGGPFIEVTPEKACNTVYCQNGDGATFLGMRGNYAICACAQQFETRRIAQWSDAWRGDEHKDGSDWYPDGTWQVSTIRKY